MENTDDEGTTTNYISKTGKIVKSVIIVLGLLSIFAWVVLIIFVLSPIKWHKPTGVDNNQNYPHNFYLYLINPFHPVSPIPQTNKSDKITLWKLKKL